MFPSSHNGDYGSSNLLRQVKYLVSVEGYPGRVWRFDGCRLEKDHHDLAKILGAGGEH
jgi:hypothetical protein